MAIIHIYGTIAISLQLCDHQDTESESCDKEMSTFQSMFTQKKISKDLWGKHGHNLQYGRRILH